MPIKFPVQILMNKFYYCVLHIMYCVIIIAYPVLCMAYCVSLNTQHTTYKYI